MSRKISKKEMELIHNTLTLIKLTNIFEGTPVLHKVKGAMKESNVHFFTLFAEMKKLQTVVIPADVKTSVMDDPNTYQKIMYNCNAVKKRYKNRRFLTRVVEDGIRVWRVA